MLTQGPAPDYRRIFILRLHLALGVHAVIVVNGEGISLIGSLLIGLVHMLLVFLVKNLFFVFLFFAFLFCFFIGILFTFHFHRYHRLHQLGLLLNVAFFLLILK